MFEHLLESSSEEEEDIFEEPVYISENRGYRKKSTTPKSAEEACRELLQDLDRVNVETDTSSNAPVTSDTSSNEEARNTNPIILSFVIFESHIGAAYYNSETWELYILDDIYDTSFNISIIKTLYRQCLPRQIITVKGTAPSVIRQLQNSILVNNSPSANNSSSNPSQSSSSSSEMNTELKLLSNTEYSYANCLSRVKILKFENEPAEMLMSGRQLYLNSIINFKSPSMVYALGLLLNYVDKNWNLTDINAGQPKFQTINHILLKDTVMLNEEAYDALNILTSSQHPSFFKFGNTSDQKSVNSLYALFNQCQSKPGSQRLWQMLHYPSKDINLIKMRLNVIEFFLQPHNQVIAENLMSCLSHMCNVSPAMLNKTTALNCKAVEWRKFYETLFHIILIGDICDKNRQHLEMFENIAKSVTEDLHQIKYFIEYIIDMEESKRKNKVTVKRGVDEALDEMIEQRERLPEILTGITAEEMKNLPPEVATCRLLYYPDICFVLSVTDWVREPPEDADLPGLEYKFTINGLRHYKSAKTRELDDTIGDVVMKIQKRESQIMTKLINYISQYTNEFVNAFRLCVDLDVLLSFFVVAQSNNYVKPEIVQDQVIAIKKSRHPLCELNSSNYVANDIYSGNGESVFKIITGPNACGKSVYLKQVALTIFMAHLGSYVPAENAVIGVMDHILTQTSNNESSAFDASAFVQDLRQMNTIVRSATRNSLIVIDEFAKSTSEVDGLAIASSVFKDLIERKSECPHVFASTHMYNVFSLIPQNDMVELQTFEYMQTETQIVFLYRLVSGHTTSSHALSVAELCGLEKSVIDESNHVIDNIKLNKVPARFNADSLEKLALIRNFIYKIYHSNEKPLIEEIKEQIDLIESIGIPYPVEKDDGSPCETT